ncbi:hypothetical protein DFS34DRAFT_624013 [Phlyctochytrium arcticum]|nr:hypothetical protein DFS34DRAFT_624013 [Phlyctochytrium arcticum]
MADETTKPELQAPTTTIATADPVSTDTTTAAPTTTSESPAAAAPEATTESAVETPAAAAAVTEETAPETPQETFDNVDEAVAVQDVPLPDLKSSGWLKKLSVRFNLTLSKRFYVVGSDETPAPQLKDLNLVYKKKAIHSADDEEFKTLNADLFKDLALATVTTKGFLLAYRSDTATTTPVALLNLRHLESAIVPPTTQSALSTNANHVIVRFAHPSRTITFAAASAEDAKAWAYTLLTAKATTIRNTVEEESEAYQTALAALQSRDAFTIKKPVAPATTAAPEGILSDSDAVLDADPIITSTVVVPASVPVTLEAATADQQDAIAKKQDNKRKRFTFFGGKPFVPTATPVDETIATEVAFPAEPVAAPRQSVSADRAEVPAITPTIEDDTTTHKKEGLFASFSTLAKKGAALLKQDASNPTEPKSTPEPLIVSDDKEITHDEIVADAPAAAPVVASAAAPVETETKEAEVEAKEVVTDAPLVTEEKQVEVEPETVPTPIVPTEAVVATEEIPVIVPAPVEEVTAPATTETSAADATLPTTTEDEEPVSRTTSPTPKKNLFTDFGSLFRKGTGSSKPSKKEIVPAVPEKDEEAPTEIVVVVEETTVAVVEEPAVAETQESAKVLDSEVPPTESAPVPTPSATTEETTPKEEITTSPISPPPTPKMKKRLTSFFGFGGQKVKSEVGDQDKKEDTDKKIEEAVDAQEAAVVEEATEEVKAADAVVEDKGKEVAKEPVVEVVEEKATAPVTPPAEATAPITSIPSIREETTAVVAETAPAAEPESVLRSSTEEHIDVSPATPKEEQSVPSTPEPTTPKSSTTTKLFGRRPATLKKLFSFKKHNDQHHEEEVVVTPVSPLNSDLAATDLTPAVTVTAPTLGRVGGEQTEEVGFAEGVMRDAGVKV